MWWPTEGEAKIALAVARIATADQNGGLTTSLSRRESAAASPKLKQYPTRWPRPQRGRSRATHRDVERLASNLRLFAYHLDALIRFASNEIPGAPRFPNIAAELRRRGRSSQQRSASRARLASSMPMPRASCTKRMCHLAAARGHLSGSASAIRSASASASGRFRCCNSRAASPAWFVLLLWMLTHSNGGVAAALERARRRLHRAENCGEEPLTNAAPH